MQFEAVSSKIQNGDCHFRKFQAQAPVNNHIIHDFNDLNQRFALFNSWTSSEQTQAPFQVQYCQILAKPCMSMPTTLFLNKEPDQYLSFNSFYKRKHDQNDINIKAFWLQLELERKKVFQSGSACSLCTARFRHLFKKKKLQFV